MTKDLRSRSILSIEIFLNFFYTIWAFCVTKSIGDHEQFGLRPAPTDLEESEYDWLEKHGYSARPKGRRRYIAMEYPYYVQERDIINFSPSTNRFGCRQIEVEQAQIMAFRQLYKELQKELSIINQKTLKAHGEKELKNRKAKLQYQKYQLIREKMPTKHIDEQLAKVDSGEMKAPRINSSIIKEIVEEKEATKMNLMHMKNITTFLRSQRVYTELIERYNPGLTMDQEDKVRRTANRVGLLVPEN